MVSSGNFDWLWQQNKKLLALAHPAQAGLGDYISQFTLKPFIFSSNIFPN